MPNDLIVAIQTKVHDFIATRRDFDQAFQLDLNHDRMTTTAIRQAIEKSRAMSNTVSKYLADTEQLEKHVASRVSLAEDTLEDAVMQYIKDMPAAEYDRFAKEERRRIALLAHRELRDDLKAWEDLHGEVKAFKKTLELAMENIRGARKDILGAIGAAKLDNAWDGTAMGKPVDLTMEALRHD